MLLVITLMSFLVAAGGYPESFLVAAGDYSDVFPGGWWRMPPEFGSP